MSCEFDSDYTIFDLYNIEQVVTRISIAITLTAKIFNGNVNNKFLPARIIVVKHALHGCCCKRQYAIANCVRLLIKHAVEIFNYTYNHIRINY